MTNLHSSGIDIQYFEVLGEFWRGLEEPRSYKIYSSGNRGVKKGPGPRGSRDEEFLVPSLPRMINLEGANYHSINLPFHTKVAEHFLHDL